MWAWVSWVFPHSWMFLCIFLTTPLSWQTPPWAPSQSLRPSPACGCSHGRVGHLARGGPAGRGASPGGCPSTGNSWGAWLVFRRRAGCLPWPWVVSQDWFWIALWFTWNKCHCWSFNFSLEKENMPFSVASENHRIGTFAFFGVSFSFAITYHLLPCRQLVNI